MTRQQKAQAKREWRARRNERHPTAHSDYATAPANQETASLRERWAKRREARKARVADRAREREELLSERRVESLYLSPGVLAAVSEAAQRVLELRDCEVGS